ncbi:MAG: LacI family transcriptional regulator [Rhizobiales bacterium 63-22]|nr:MAG: LacI family transcriptional regulator [Rhizobiales bacterium 63-22]
MRMGKPTIVELARAAGVSVTTVSHAFSGRRYVDPETCKRIQAIAREMGYRANPRARRLRTGGAASIALVSSMPFAVAAGPSRLGFLMEIAAAAAMPALSNGLALCIVPPLGPDVSLDALEVDGVVIIEPARDDRLLEFFCSRGLPVVSIGRVPDRDDIAFVDLQSEKTATIMLDHLASGGGRIGLITGVERRNSYLETEAAYLRHAAVNGYEPVAVRIDECGGEEAAAEVAADLLRRMPDIAALCVPVDAFATGVLKAAKALNRPVPAGLRIATRYDGLRAKLASPPLTAVNLHLDQIAATAVDLLIAQLQNREAQPPVYLPPELVPRASSA